jgi:hypothetical protein
MLVTTWANSSAAVSKAAAKSASTFVPQAQPARLATRRIGLDTDHLGRRLHDRGVR